MSCCGSCGEYYYWTPTTLVLKLSNRAFYYVMHDNTMSNIVPVRSGVPQGSILGLLLFIVYLNDITENISLSHCFLLFC